MVIFISFTKKINLNLSFFPITGGLYLCYIFINVCNEYTL